MIKSAALNDVDIIVFPELSLTGYEPELSSSLELSIDDINNLPFRKISNDLNITCVVSAPVRSENKLPYLSAIVFRPGEEPIVSSKINLHAHEFDYFTPSESVITFSIKDIVFGIAICADSLNKSHILNLEKRGVHCCLAPSLITDDGYDHDVNILSKYSGDFELYIAMSNYVDSSGGYFASGKSVIIDNNSQVIAQSTIDDVGCAIADIRKG
jgi:predicted amidohydrolase